MRELNQKIYEVAGLENTSGEAEYDDSVSIGQVITDNYLNEGFDGNDNTLSREEANKVIKEERESIYGREGGPISATNPNLKLKEVFGSSTSDKTKSTKLKTAPKKGATSPKTKVKTASKSTKSSKKGSTQKSKIAKKGSASTEKKQGSNTAILLLILAAAVAVYYFLSE